MHAYVDFCMFVCFQARAGQKLKCDIIYTRPEYMLAMLKGHAKGKLAYISTLTVSATANW